MGTRSSCLCSKQIKLSLCVYMDVCPRPPCQLAAASMPNTLPSSIYVFAQPCDLTLSQATSTLGHVTRQAEICPMTCISMILHIHTYTPPFCTHNSHLTSFKSRQLFATMRWKEPSAPPLPFPNRTLNFFSLLCSFMFLRPNRTLSHHSRLSVNPNYKTVMTTQPLFLEDFSGNDCMIEGTGVYQHHV